MSFSKSPDNGMPQKFSFFLLNNTFFYSTLPGLGSTLEGLETVKPPLPLHYFRLLVVYTPLSSDSLTRRRVQKVDRFVGLLPPQPSNLTELCI